MNGDDFHVSRLTRMRVLYIALALCLAGIASSISEGEAEVIAANAPLTTCIFALACGSCLLASIDPLRQYWWKASGWIVGTAVVWRIITLGLLTAKNGTIYERSPRFAVAIISLWLLALVGAYALWTHALRPERDCE